MLNTIISQSLRWPSLILMVMILFAALGYKALLETPMDSLPDLTRLQDWFIKQELQSVKGVSEVAKVGGMVQSFQVVLQPLKLLQYGITLTQIESILNKANSEIGGSVVELSEAEYMVRSQGYLTSIEDFQVVPLGINNQNGSPLLLKDIATIRLGPETRRGVAEWNGEGEVVGGIVVMRDGENALKTIEQVKQKIIHIQAALPKGVTIQTAYDRTGLINRAIENLKNKLVLEMITVVLVCALFLLHAVADIQIKSGPSLIKSENARNIGWVFIDYDQTIPIGDFVDELESSLANLKLPPKVIWQVAGEYEYLQRVKEKLFWIVPTTLFIIFVLLQLTLKSSWQSLLV